MKKLGEWVKFLGKRLPVGGIVAFSLCSTWSLYYLFSGRAAHPTPLYWLPAVLVELVTAWVVAQIVGQARQLTKSNLSKQDRRFFFIILIAFVLVALPLVSVSVWANTLEFSSLVLGALFPVASIGCAVGAALPIVVAKFDERKAKERKERAEARKETAKVAAKEAKRAQKMENLGKSAEIFALMQAEPGLSHAEMAERLGKTRQTVSYHVKRLEKMGIMGGNGTG